MLKLILLNIRNTLILLILAYLSIPFIAAAGSMLVTAKPDERAHLVNYKNEPWAEQHFKELDEIDEQLEYRAFVIWRHKSFSGKTINIDKAEGIRITPPIPGLPKRPATYFFGGSTMWGIGVNDEKTIPAYYQAMFRETAVNYGETGWTAHQSLNQLMEIIESGLRPDTVVFYDGVNEILAKCGHGNNFFSHYSEKRMADALKNQPTEAGYYLRSVKEAVRFVSTIISGSRKSDFDCDTNPQKAALVAEALVSDWAAAKSIAETSGARFFAFLQPIAFLSKTRLSHLPPDALDPEVAKQYEAVYPFIRAKMKERGIGTDLSRSLDVDDYVYVDNCHLSPNGNSLIAEAMRKAMTAPTD